MCSIHTAGTIVSSGPDGGGAITQLNSHIVSIVALAGLVLSAVYLVPEAGGAGNTARPGALGPGFPAKDIAGLTVSLANHVGKPVILEC